ncbi:hypothetical protein [Agarivorans sp. Toyoura001]|uniref:hypothetical protein n=1 Tax=unclassified Agarivorans TaxID=2636026 RepID=UPI0010EB53ED|nr:hypothetical protein [Agarivorans sp. Toyoura001]GDY26937.1 hypothetical protein AHAT_28270 [Agarivorans sp. Toyoura001]
MNIKTSVYALIFAGLISSTAHAANIQLKDGRALQGDIVSQNAETLVLDMQGIEVKLPTEQVASIDFNDTNNIVTPAPAAEEPVTSQASNEPVEVPAGTILTIRMSESVNTRQHETGQRFTATLEANLMSGDTVVAKRGSTVYGELSEVKKAGRIAGSADMAITLTSILINDQMHDIHTDILSSSGANTAGDTVGKTARAAAIGGLINGSDGAKNGAKVGVGASVLTQGNDIELPKDSLIEFTLAAPLVA